MRERKKCANYHQKCTGRRVLKDIPQNILKWHHQPVGDNGLDDANVTDEFWPLR